MSGSNKKSNANTNVIKRGTLTHRGFKIPIKKLSTNERKDVMNQLTIKPESYIGADIQYQIFERDGKVLYLPRYYSIKKFCNNNKKNCKNMLLPGESVNFKFTLPNFKLKEIQKITYTHILSSFDKYGTAIAKLGCGVGKTVLSIYLIQKLKRKALVVVPKLNLMDQWKKEIEKYTDAKVGILHRDKIDYEGKDIIITNIHTVIGKTDPVYANIYKRCGVVILDEAHHLNYKEFSKVLQKVNSNYVLGLTATPKKGERMKINHVFQQFIGPIVPPDSVTEKYLSNNDNKGNVITNVVKYAIDSPYLSEHLVHEYYGKPNVAGMITNISKNKTRTDVIVHYLQQLSADKNRHILVASDRKLLLKSIYAKLQALGISSGLYIGGLTQDELNETKTKKILLGTYAICEEGLNVTTLNTLFIVTPRRDCEQLIGRVLRIQHSIPVLVVDFVDTFSQTLVNQGYARTKYCKDKGYQIERLKIEDKNNIPRLVTKLETQK